MARGLKYISEVMENKEFSRRLMQKAHETIDPYDVLHHYGADNIQPKSKTGEIIHSCLIDRVHPHHSNGDATPSASLNSETMLYGCWSYEGGFNIVGLVELLEGSREAAMRVLTKLSSGESSTSFLEQIESMFAKDEVDEIPKFNKVLLKPWSFIHPYFLDRGLTKKTIMEAHLGYDKDDVRVTIPHFWRGDLVGWQKRRLDDPRYPQTEDGPKYKNSFKFPKDETLYGYDLANKREPVVLFEGVMETLMARQRGYNAIGSFSAKITEKQIEHLRSFPKVTVFYDFDPAGLMGARKILKHLSDHTSVEVVFSETDKDFDLMSEEEAARQIENAEDSVFAWLRLESMDLRGKN